MPNRIDEMFARLRSENRAAFIPYICAGDPTLDQTVNIARGLVSAGVDLLELGVPFSDPLADGVVNQLAAQRALEAGTGVNGVLKCVRDIRLQTEVPIVLYTYMNPLFQFGWDAFHIEATRAGVDALLILDLPHDEEVASDNLLPHIRLIAPTTSAERLTELVQNAAGFLYYVSREGVTGARADVASSLEEKLVMIRELSQLPVAVGFGISTPDQAGQVARLADAVVVGSAIVNEIGKRGDIEGLADSIMEFAAPIARAVHDARA